MDTNFSMARNVCDNGVSNPEDYRSSYFFEIAIPYTSYNGFMTEHFPKAWALTIFYALAVHAGQHYMKNRKAFQLKTALLFWNVLLALYSMFALYRVAGEMLWLARNNGFHSTICDMATAQHKSMIGFWTVAFSFSKVLELGDTVFIVLRKTPLIFLHWYHHVATLLFVWYSCVNVSSMGRWFQVINLFVHSIMYSYFALKVLNVKVPPRVSMAITSIQLLQMAVGIYLSVYAYRMTLLGVDCCADYKMIFSAWGMYLSYFLLFLNFFVKSYLGKRHRGDKDVCRKKGM